MTYNEVKQVCTCKLTPVISDWRFAKEYLIKLCPQHKDTLSAMHSFNDLMSAEFDAQGKDTQLRRDIIRTLYNDWDFEWITPLGIELSKDFDHFIVTQLSPTFKGEGIIVELQPV